MAAREAPGASAQASGEEVATGEAATISLRSLSLVATVLFGLLTTTLVVGLLLASRMVWRSLVAADENIGAVAVTVELSHTLREYHRLQTLLAATEESEVAEAAVLAEAELRRLLATMDPYTRDIEEERVALNDLTVRVDELVAGWTALNQGTQPLEARVLAMRPAIESALEISAQLRNDRIAMLREARDEAKRAIDAELRVAVVVTAFLVGGLVLIVFGMRRVVLRPIFTLHDALRRFRDGDMDVRAGDGRLVELRELTAAFNEMTGAIARQRRDQLTFLAAVAHDLRSPLAVLKMGFQVVAHGGEPITGERLERFERQVDRLSRMVGDLLDTARIEAGELELQLENFDLREAVAAMVDSYRPTSIGHELVLELPAEPVMVHGDSLRLEQVVSNLLSNAIKYSPGGGPVEVEVRVAGNEARVTVRDEGLGMSQEDLEGLFQPFRRGAKMVDVLPGVGLGLSIVRRIVNAHGGRVEVESRPRGGSTFTVFLPLGEGSLPSGRQGPSSARPA